MVLVLPNRAPCAAVSDTEYTIGAPSPSTILSAAASSPKLYLTHQLLSYGIDECGALFGIEIDDAHNISAPPIKTFRSAAPFLSTPARVCKSGSGRVIP